MMVGAMSKQLLAMNNFKISMHCDLELEINRALPSLMDSRCVKFPDNR